MNNPKEKKRKCENCRRRTATLECEECGSIFCDKCFGEWNECPFCEPPRLVKMVRKGSK